MPSAAGAVHGATSPPSAQRPAASGSSQVRPLRRKPPDARPPVPRQGMLGQAGPCVCTRGGQVQELLGAAPLPGQCVPCEREAWWVARRWGLPPPLRRERRTLAPPGDETPEGPAAGRDGGRDAAGG